MDTYLEQVNAPILYLIVAAVLGFITLMCIVFLVKSYRSGLALGMDKKMLKKAITSSATFTVLPSISILLGVIALSGTLGVPLSWLRLSVIGALQYELNVAEMAANAIGLDGLKLAELSIGSYTTIALVMTAGILGGIFLSIFFLKKYLTSIQKPKVEAAAGYTEKKPGFGSYATIAMFIGLCSAYIGSYIGTWISNGNAMPILVALIAAASMAIFEFFTVKKKIMWLDNFSLACSMLIAMTGAVLINRLF